MGTARLAPGLSKQTGGTHVLKRQFGLDSDTAKTVMMHAHRQGEARIGAWQKDIAQTATPNAEEEALEDGQSASIAMSSS
jgi:ATP-dependent Clp protease adapter protein ClpS